jgi:zinc protease
VLTNRKASRYVMMSLSGLMLVSLISAPLTVLAKTTPSSASKAEATTSGADSWRKTPPTLPQPRALQMPNPIVFSLPNGLKVELLEDHRVPFVTAQLGIKSGSVFDPKDKIGLASLTAEMLTEGTTTRNSKQLADEVDFLGAALKGGADADYMMVSGSVLSKYKDRFLNALSDVVLNPTFPEDELALAKTNILQELTVRRSRPSFLLEERFHKVIFGDHPYSVVAPTPESVNAITRADLESFHKEHFVPNESVLVVVGDFNPDEMKALIEKSFGTWKEGKLPAPDIANPPTLKGQKIYLVDRPGSVQSSLKLGNLAIKKTDPDYFAAIVANQILGGAAFSRLFLNIREQKGYTYGAYSGFAPRKEPGAFAAQAEVRTPVTGESLQEFLYEIQKLRNVKATDKELDAAKRYITGNFQLGLETQGGLAQRLLEQELYELPENYLETYTSKVMAVTPEDVRRVARDHMDLNDLAIVIVGDASKIKKELEYFAPLEVYDTTGKVVTESQPLTAN